jgi:hypothetical protein
MTSSELPLATHFPDEATERTQPLCAGSKKLVFSEGLPPFDASPGTEIDKEAE